MQVPLHLRAPPELAAGARIRTGSAPHAGGFKTSALAPPAPLPSGRPFKCRSVQFGSVRLGSTRHARGHLESPPIHHQLALGLIGGARGVLEGDVCVLGAAFLPSSALALVESKCTRRAANTGPLWAQFELDKSSKLEACSMLASSSSTNRCLAKVGVRATG